MISFPIMFHVLSISKESMCILLIDWGFYNISQSTDEIESPFYEFSCFQFVGRQYSVLIFVFWISTFTFTSLVGFYQRLTQKIWKAGWIYYTSLVVNKSWYIKIWVMVKFWPTDLELGLWKKYSLYACNQKS